MNEKPDSQETALWETAGGTTPEQNEARFAPKPEPTPAAPSVKE